MKIKTKLILALSLLFLMILALSGLAIRHVRQLAGDTKNILVANYQSLDYARNMYMLLGDAAMAQPAREKFQDYINRQKANITEAGEQEITLSLQEDFNALLKDTAGPAPARQVRADLNTIMKLNMDAIKRKSITAENTADDAVLWISLTSAFCFIIGFTIIVNLPGYIANPIRDLTVSIQQIAARNYSQRVAANGQDEFALLARSFNTMAEKLQEYSNSSIEQLMMEKRRIETLIDNLSDPVIGLDEKNRILFINREATKVSGLNKQNVIGKQAGDIALHNDLLRLLLQQPEDNKEAKEPLKIYADNKESYFEKITVPIRIVPTGEEASKKIGSFIILKNITAYKELDSAKTNFIATVSHEFKTPIASMKMSLQLLGNEHTGTLNDEQRNLLAGIKDDTDRLLRTTGELLNITQVETGKTSVQTESLQVNTIITEAIEANSITASAKQISITTDIPDGLPQILADREKAAWIMSNLISNAIRYSHENSEIRIKAGKKDNNVIIDVTDFGIGIPEDYLPKIFEKYYRVPGSNKEGTGLGLAISREFMQAQGGRIEVHSSPGKGSTFLLLFNCV